MKQRKKKKKWCYKCVINMKQRGENVNDSKKRKKKRKKQNKNTIIAPRKDMDKRR